MKLYISVDMEGMAGICHPRQESDDQIRFRKNMQQAFHIFSLPSYESFRPSDMLAASIRRFSSSAS